MDTIRLAHQFFHFSYATELALWGDFTPREEDIRLLFREEILPRRALKTGNTYTYEEAVPEFSRLDEWGQKIGLRAIRPEQFPTSLVRFLPGERLPPLLYVRGADLPEEADCVSVVGTRYPSQLGRDSSGNFSSYLTTQGLKVVSGLAKGVDTIAHRENLRLGTVAVLGSGVDDVYPTENATLGERVLERGGTLVSPFPLAQVPLPHNFPQRNELIAALSAGTIVIEGNQTSGAAITGRQALAMGKCVIALSQDFRSGFGRGAISLQQAGATLVSSEEEALQAIFSRFGGFGRQPLPMENRRGNRRFSYRDFLEAAGGDSASAAVLLEEGILSGRIEREGPDQYRLTKGSRADAKR